jgi:hypothetical protein
MRPNLPTFCVSCLAAALLIFSVLAFSPARAAPSLTGIWYGEGQPDDPNIVYLDFFSADGTFISEFRKYERCVVVGESVQSGIWTAKGQDQNLVTTQIDGDPVHLEHSYTIELLTDAQVRARLKSNGYLFIENRVDRFEFPACFRGS